MLILSQESVDQAVSLTDVMDAVELAYRLYDEEQFHMDARTHMSCDENTLLLMPCAASDSIGTKIVTVFPNNETHPVTQGLMLLTDRTTGEAKALLNGTYLTGLRTGALGGLAARYLSPRSASSLGLIGTGVQGFYQLLAISEVRPIEHIYLFNRTKERAATFKQEIQSRLPTHVNIHVADSPEQVTRHSDIIVTATTSETPVLPNERHMYNSKTIIAVGSFQPHMRELPDELFKQADYLFIDTLDAMQETGDVITPIKNQWIHKSQCIPFSSIVAGHVSVSASKDRPMIFKSTGMALFDVIAAQTIYEKAVRQGAGQTISL
ncbi:ornithine cyclodeaminase family protein [Bacillus thermotolerans]|uniref:ornithine cyclodeaminase family protein n=1 Tax=Bacillus thermotolerans TaxID=1221996 RepID=UPI00057C4805|nr:ornithine cyclodeaminase family protein [Bacillus thermotolerans]KKB38241.1 Ornithine cyclodeaminase [Bacillus thermotolerans]